MQTILKESVKFTPHVCTIMYNIVVQFNLPYHSKITKSILHGYRQNEIKKFSFRNFSKFQIEVESGLHKHCCTSWSQIHKISIHS